MSEMPGYKVHVFICTNQKGDGKVCCGGKESQTLWKEVKKEAYERWGKENLRINSANCLGHCDQGIACVIYPQGEWLLHLDSNSSKEDILKEIEKLMG